MSLVQRRIQQLSEADLKQQLWFIRASLTTLAMGEEQGATRKSEFWQSEGTYSQ